jgi:hypothetical protein
MTDPVSVEVFCAPCNAFHAQHELKGPLPFPEGRDSAAALNDRVYYLCPKHGHRLMLATLPGFARRYNLEHKLTPEVGAPAEE